MSLKDGLTGTILDSDKGIVNRAPCINFHYQKYNGKLVVFEGVDGAGKSTSVDYACNYLESKGVNYHKIDMLSAEFRNLSYHRLYADDHTIALKGGVDQTSIAICAMGDRLQRFRTIFQQKLEAGDWLVCDRYIFTPLSEALALGISDQDLVALIKIAELFPEPDLGFVVAVEPEIAIERIHARPDESDKELDVRFYRRATQAFLVNGKKNGFVELNTVLGHSIVKETIELALQNLILGDE